MEKVEKKSELTGTQGGWRNRRYTRVMLEGFSADLADNNGIHVGVIQDVSATGLKMVGLPPNFSAEKRFYRMVLAGKGRYYKAMVIPCWTRKDAVSDSLDVGFRLVSSPWEWTEFVLDKLVLSEYDNRVASQA